MSNWIIIKPLLSVLAFIHSYQKMHKTEEQVYEELYWNILVALTGWSIVFAPALLLMLRSERERSLDDKFIGITVERTSKTISMHYLVISSFCIFSYYFFNNTYFFISYQILKSLIYN